MSYYINDSMEQINNYDTDNIENFNFGEDTIRFSFIIIIFIIGLVLVVCNIRGEQLFYKYDGLIFVGLGVLGVIYNFVVEKDVNFDFKKCKKLLNKKKQIEINDEIQNMEDEADLNDLATVQIPQYRI